MKWEECCTCLLGTHPRRAEKVEREGGQEKAKYGCCESCALSQITCISLTLMTVDLDAHRRPALRYHSCCDFPKRILKETINEKFAEIVVDIKEPILFINPHHSLFCSREGRWVYCAYFCWEPGNNEQNMTEVRKKGDSKTRRLKDMGLVLFRQFISSKKISVCCRLNAKLYV